MRDLLVRWAERFDWRGDGAELDAPPHFRARVDGLAVHFVHVRSRERDALPIVLTPGWPSSFHEMWRLMPRLANPAADPSDAFDVVAPWLPGWFSDNDPASA